MSLPKPHIRSSSMPLFMACSNSMLNPDNLPRVEQENEMSLAGTLVHGLAEQTVKEGTADLESLRPRLSVQEFDRAGRLYRNFLRAWKEASKVFVKPQLEVYLEAELPWIKLSGHMDVIEIHKNRAYILDYKAGRQHEDHYHQMAGYAYLAWDKAGRPPAPKFRVDATVLYLEDLSVHPYTFKVPDILAWEAEVGKQVEQVRYTVGRKCANCPLHYACPAYAAFNKGTLQLFNDDTTIPQKTWEQMDPAERGALLDRIYMVERAADRAKLGLRNLVKQEGRVDIGGGFEMTLVDDTTMFLDTRRSLPTLKVRLGMAEINRISRIPIDEALSSYAKRAGKGLKTKARDNLLAELDAVGAVVRYKTTKMWRRPIGEQTLEESK